MPRLLCRPPSFVYVGSLLATIGLVRCCFAADAPGVQGPNFAAQNAEGSHAAANQVDFRKEVLPIFQRACHSCHGPEVQKSGYRLDIRQVALTGGDSYAPNIVAGKSGESSLIEFVSGKGDTKMPPEGAMLSAAEVAKLANWIDQGAYWPDELAGKVADRSDWWAWKPLKRPAVPETVNRADPEANPIDGFIAVKLAEHQLSPAPLAERRTLIRRLFYDLIGLPPSPEEVETFAASNDPHAYEKLVDRLLASPRYGERWARHWMDAVHFAETHGHDQDRIRENAWRYRDYLIDAFNADKPYARFIQEQVAGDALFPDDPQATIALGFLAAGPWDESSLRDIQEDTLDRQIARYLDRDDMIATVMNNVVSLTVQCARCHNHKFDPISQADYYSLQAVFAGVERANRAVDLSPEVGRRRSELTKRKQSLEQQTPESTAWLASKEVQEKVAAWEQGLAAQRVRWTILEPDSIASADGAELTLQPDHSIVSGGLRPDQDTYTIVARSTLDRVTALRLEVFSDECLPQRGPGRQDNGNLHLSELQVFADTGMQFPIALASATADFNQEGWSIERAIDGAPQTAWGIFPRVGQSHSAVFEVREPLKIGASTQITVVLKQLHGGGHLIGRFRLAVTDAKPPVGIDVLPSEIAEALNVAAGRRSQSQRLLIARHVATEQIIRELAVLPEPAVVYAAASQFEPDGGFKPPPGPRPIHLLHRGDISQPGELAVPGTVGCVAALPARFYVENLENESARRIALARWLTDRENSLTWRSIVNRIWHHHFGAGLVRSLNDFGHLGSAPSHPELLDWLAANFRDGGGSLKRLHRLIVTSATYRQTSATKACDAQLLARANSIDADNRLLWRMNRQRLDAECVHDAVLAFADRLDLRMGGPSDRQFDLQPGIHVTPKVDYAKFNNDSDAGRRRSVYRFLFRTLPDPFMEALDCPSGDQIAPARLNTITVQQALAVWNDAFVLRNCDYISQRLKREAATPAAQVELAVNLILGRPTSAEEKRDLVNYTNSHGLQNLCRLLLNRNEFMFVD